MAVLYIRKIDYFIRVIYFFGFVFSLLKGNYSTCGMHTQLSKQASVARILLAGFFGMFSNSINKIILDAETSKYNKKMSTTSDANVSSQNKMNPTATKITSPVEKSPFIFSTTKL